MGGFQVALGIGLELLADGFDRGLLANAGQHILQRAARGMVIEHLVGGEQRHLCRYRDAMQPRQTALVVTAMKLAFGEVEEIGKLQMAFALLDPLDIVAAFAAGEQLAEPAVGGAVARIDQDIRRAVDEDDA